MTMKRPLSVLKYAMTLDGKIAATTVGPCICAALPPDCTLFVSRNALHKPEAWACGGRQGHSAWVSGESARACVFELRARSDAVIVGGQTTRRDNPNLTTRRESGHTPTRIVLSRGLDLPNVSLPNPRPVLPHIQPPTTTPVSTASRDVSCWAHALCST